jgi:hypothetical protein
MRRELEDKGGDVDEREGGIGDETQARQVRAATDAAPEG